MKFGHTFQEALKAEDFPPQWVEAAIPYRALKKQLKKIQSELESWGLDSATLAQLQKSHAFQYDFEGQETFVPKLTFFIKLENGVAVDAVLSPATRRYLESLALKQQQNSIDNTLGHDGQVQNPSPEEGEETIAAEESSNLRRVEVELRFDAEFFGLLQNDVISLDNIQTREQKTLIDEIQALSTSVAAVAKPTKFTKFQKSDLYRWRELFDIYLQAGIFFSTNELDHGNRTGAMAAEKLNWFQSEVMRRGIKKSFKLLESHEALKRFTNINIELLRNLKFQEVNQQAITKILKKFDKRTNLGAATTFPKLILSDAIMSRSMAKAVCQQVSQDLIRIVPQVEDFACPICSDIVWRPIRMDCKHLLCIRCTIVLQRQRKPLCPMCRGDVIMKANTDNIDEELSKYLKKFFKKEVALKQIQNEIEDGRERFGILYVHPSEDSACTVM